MDELATIVMAIATVAIATFTWLVWRNQIREQMLTHFARLRVCASRAQFNPVSREIKVEVLLQNESVAPAVVQSWSVLLKDGQYQEEISEGANLQSTRLLHSVSFIGGKGWVIFQKKPTALSLSNQIGRAQFGPDAEAQITVEFLGAKEEVGEVSELVKLEIADTNQS